MRANFTREEGSERDERQGGKKGTRVEKEAAAGKKGERETGGFFGWRFEGDSRFARGEM
jgi:hypothetical protein